MNERTSLGPVGDHASEDGTTPKEEVISGPEKLMLWLFVVWFVFFAMILFGGLLASFMK